MPPQGTAGSVPRTALLERLQRSRQSPVVVLAAGPGYGKTTLLSQWDSRSRRPFAWLTLDDGDNDPVVFLTYVAAALDRVTRLGPDVFDALGSPSVSIEGTAIPRLGAAIASMPRSVVLILEDLHLLRDRQCLDAVDELARHLPAGSQLALSTRGEPTPSMGARRAGGTVLEIGPEELKMECDEARQLLEAADVMVDEDELAALNGRAEGWAAGLYLAALSIRSSRREERSVSDFRGGDRFVAEYLESELFESFSSDELRFLRRSSVLSRMSGPLCDAVLETENSAESLERLQRSNRFVVPLDREREWYRFHHLFGELLRAELRRAEPELAPRLCRRAAGWLESRGQPEAAISYAQQAEDPQLVGELVLKNANRVFESGRGATVGSWLGWLEERSYMERNQAVAMQGAMALSVLGQAEAAERWADAAERGSFEGELPDGSQSIGSWLALLRAFRGSEGAERMRADAQEAVETLARSSAWRPAALAVLAMSRWILGDTQDADDLFERIAQEGLDLGVPNAVTVALAERGAIAIERGDWGEAEELAHRALLMLRSFRMEEIPLNALAYTIAARTALHRGDARAGAEMLTRAQRLRPRLTHGVPVLPVQARLELARAYLAMGDAAGAGTALREADSLLGALPDLGKLPGEAEEVRSQLKTIRTTAAGASALTGAELRLLPQLVTHLSFREIGERLFISQHTVKTQAVSIYRKLDVTSRSGAVERAREIGLL